jgi:hypothetical protein
LVQAASRAAVTLQIERAVSERVSAVQASIVAAGYGK